MIVPDAISDQSGSAEFIEYNKDSVSCCASDTSNLVSDINIHTNTKSTTYTVKTITLDEYIAQESIKPSAIKIDIEGFEFYALQGAKKTLQTYLPYLCIDIHADVKTGKSSLLTIQPFLYSLFYTLSMEEHTLYGIPPQK